MKKITILILLTLGLCLEAQNIRKSSWQRVETNSSTEPGVSVYYFDLTDTTIKSTNRKGTKNFGTWDLGRFYVNGTVRFVYTMLSDNLLEFRQKDSFTRQYITITYKLK